MKFRKFGRISLALAVSLGTGIGVTSCSTDHAVGYLYVTGSQYNQISGFRIDNNLGNLTTIPDSPFGSGGFNPIKALVTNAGKFLYVLTDPHSPGKWRVNGAVQNFDEFGKAFQCKKGAPMYPLNSCRVW